MCKKTLAERVRECPRCRTDLSILVSYVDELHEGLIRAEQLTRAGKLAEAVWAYLEVLEVDPENSAARKQVSQVAAAVRQFDRVAIGRRWRDRLQRHAVFRRWMASWQEPESRVNLAGTLGVIVLVVIALLFGYWLGRTAEPVRDVSQPAIPATTSR
jgi:hypothetical protein